MFMRLLYRLGLLLGGLAGFVSLRRPAPLCTTSANISLSEILFDLTGDALVVWDRAGGIVSRNSAAQALVGSRGQPSLSLCYPTGQAVPPGQLPWNRACRTGTSAGGTDYCFTDADGSVRRLDVSARPLPGGGAAAAFRDRTAWHESREREAQAREQHPPKRQLSRRISPTTGRG